MEAVKVVRLDFYASSLREPVSTLGGKPKGSFARNRFMTTQFYRWERLRQAAAAPKEQPPRNLSGKRTSDSD